MKVRMKETVLGTIQGKRTIAGEVVDLPDGAAADLCAKGLAEPVAEKPSERAESRGQKSPCPEDGCDYEGSERGLKIHTGQVHG